MAQGAAIERNIAAFAFLLAGSGVAGAEPQAWLIDAGKSRLGIIYRINGDERRGEISRFAGWARFDPDDLSTAEMALVIDMGSVDVGEPFGTMIAKTSDWFDVSAHPEARYTLDRMEPLGDDRFLAIGRLAMRGIERPVAGEATLSLDGPVAETKGEARFARSLFGVGAGFTALFVEVGDEVAVEFDLRARPEELK
ncbi:MAG: YceI family protein [Paracoccaceae bacterium]